MKKWWTVVCSAMLAVSITACGNKEEAAQTPAPAAETTAPTETPAAETTTPAEAAEEPAVETSANDEVPTAEELLNRTQEANQELKNYNMVADIEQHISANGEEQTMTITMDTDMVLDPVTAYQKIHTEVSGSSNDIEQYITPDAIYVGANDQWTKLPEEQRSEVMASLESTANLESSFEQFQSIAKDMEVTEEGDNYVLSAALSGDQVKSMAEEMMGQSGDEQMAAILQQMNIEEMNMTYTINKETSYPVETNVDMTMSMNAGEAAGEGAEDMDVSMHMIMNSTISKHNKIANIEVPQTVVDSVQ
ncbi:DUF6612 family protein [Saccharibacillus kuerlensis]|uniref:Lipoprotein n=1 Tax=Saccharibacillus kuerlensis TaxID=459527 RepID=A0ABQ2L569_9BACL|nr:DUF6612 family protein [Saccharibacillus kuerlensis]GGO03679.1 hypothetical protein GCM10010969_28080 [Saccharibacillus kuerlensis]